MNDAAEFQALATAVLRRFRAQNDGVDLPEPELGAVAGRLWELIRERGLPRPLAPGEQGSPGSLPEAEAGEMFARAAGGTPDPWLAEGARQLVKACFYPEFTVCRDSFCEVTSDGRCKRQDAERVRKRVSGTHCVDCPYWVTLDPDEHTSFLARHWRRDPEELAAQRDLFLPEDFRALRRWLHAAARR